MSIQNKVITTFNHGTASVLIGSRKLTIAESSQDDREYFCPIELVSAALGS